jgi:hypothetical protein
MKESLSELYVRHPFDHDERYWRGKKSLEETIASAADLHLLEDPIQHLEELHVKDFHAANDINDALLGLPPEAVIHSLGDEIALWSSLTSSISGDNDKMNKALEEVSGHSAENLEIARGWNWRQERGTSHRIKAVLAQYGLMQSLGSGVVEDIDLPAILHASVREGVELSAKRIEDYELIPIETARYNSYYDGGSVKGWETDKEKRVAYDTWLDSPSGFGLLYKGMPNAMAGIAMKGLDEVLLHQIQGVQAHRIDPTQSAYSDGYDLGRISSRGLAPLDWQKVLVTINEQIAGTLGHEKTGILAAENNVWIKKRMSRDTEPHLPIEKAIQAYDVPAQRLGYTRGTEQKPNWHKTL